MERKEILKKIVSIDNELSTARNILKSIKETDYVLFPAVYESLTLTAAMKAEKTACNFRHLIYSTLNVTKRDLMKKTAAVHETDINYIDGIFTVTLPALLPKKKKSNKSEFITDPLYFALDEYFTKNNMEIFKECVVVFEYIYDKNTPSRRICDYDNIEIKPVLDAVSAFAMTDDGGKLCDIFHTAKLGEKDCTKISVMTKNKFCERFAKR